ncbi:MAG: hypothetical protein K5739_11235 [Lachnospiraceae bacterium]|nr:hypothetical protein [Lachnospiraceae bacterium]
MNRFEIIKKYIDEYDYYRLLAGGAPDDEFDKYSHKIADIINENDPVEEIAALISGIMDKAFGQEINPDNFIGVAEKIKKELLNNK